MTQPTVIGGTSPELDDQYVRPSRNGLRPCWSQVFTASSPCRPPRGPVMSSPVPVTTTQSPSIGRNARRTKSDHACRTVGGRGSS